MSCRKTADAAALLTDPVTAEVVSSFPLLMVTLDVGGRYIASRSIQGVDVTHPAKARERNRADYLT